MRVATMEGRNALIRFQYEQPLFTAER